MPVSLSTVEAIFRRLLARYGAAWRLKWAGVPEADVKADWVNVLAALPEHAVRYGLEHLPVDFPPTAYQFREACLRAPEPKAPPALDAPKPDPARLKRVFEHMHAIAAKRRPTDWIADLEARQAAGEQLAPHIVRAMENAREVLGLRGAGGLVVSETDLARTDELKRVQAQRVDAYARANGIAL